MTREPQAEPFDDETEERLRERLSALLHAAVGEILTHQESGRFLRWMRDEAPGRFPEVFGASLMSAGTEEGEVTAEAVRGVATGLGLALWNVTPLPGNRWRPRPLPKPGRNEPCLCGSGRKYKQCCAVGGIPPAPPPEEIWLAVMDHLSPQELHRLAAAGTISPQVLTIRAGEALDEGDLEMVVALLAPLFAGDLAKKGPGDADPLAILLDAYEMLGLGDEAQRLLARVQAEGSKPLRAAAWQWRGILDVEEGRIDDARAAADEARRFDPRHPSLGMLDVSILLNEERWDDAVSLAESWLDEVEQYLPEADPRRLFFAEVIEDPQGALAMEEEEE